MVIATDLFHMMDDPGGPSHVNFDEPVATFDARYMLAGSCNWSVAGNVMQPAVDGDGVLIDVPTADRVALILKTKDDDNTNPLLELHNAADALLTHLFIPDQTDYIGTLVLGTGGLNLTHVATNHGRHNTFVGIGAGDASTSAHNDFRRHLVCPGNHGYRLQQVLSYITITIPRLSLSKADSNRSHVNPSKPQKSAIFM